MNYDDLDINILKENYSEDLLLQINYENVHKICKYLNNNGIFYTKDLFLISLDLFLLEFETFVKKFETLKEKLGNNFIEKLAEDISLINIMYEE